MSNSLSKYHENIEDELFNKKYGKIKEITLDIPSLIYLKDNIEYLEHLSDTFHLTSSERSNFKQILSNIKCRLQHD